MQQFAARKAQTLNALAFGDDDRSPKGSVDAPIAELLEIINGSAAYFTTSSCSGRVALCHESPSHPNRWLLVSHEPISFDDVASCLRGYSATDDSDSVKIVFEPFILCIECRDLDAASALWQAAVASGCRESGIQTTGSRHCRIHVSIRCSVRLEVPLAAGSIILVEHRYLQHITGIIKEKFDLNQKKIDLFSEAFSKLIEPRFEPKFSSSLIVDRCHVDKLVKALKELGNGMLDTQSGRKIRAADGNRRIVPVSEAARVHIDALSAELSFQIDLVEDEVPPESTSETPYQRLRRMVADLGIPESLLGQLPKRWEQLDDLVLLPSSAVTDPEWERFDPRKIYSVMAEALGVRRIGRQAPIDPSTKRDSRATLLLGDCGWVKQKENGIIYEFDITKTMFSSGNGTERIRMGQVVKPGEVIADLFCGIGYFSIPALVHGKAAFAYLCEWNSNTEVALRRSLAANHIDPNQFHIHPGDNREAKLENVADRVLLGLIPTSEMSWTPALRALKPSGGWLHIHENVSMKAEADFALNLMKKLDNLIADLPSERKRRWEAKVSHIEVVKSYAPRINHCVFDVLIQ